MSDDFQLAPDLLGLIACPMCEGQLKPSAGDSGAPKTLRCAACGALYPIVDGIPHLVPPKVRTSSGEPADGSGAREMID